MALVGVFTGLLANGGGFLAHHVEVPVIRRAFGLFLVAFGLFFVIDRFVTH